MSKAAKAIVLLSGGLDSSTVLAIAQGGGYACHTLSFDYGQRHRAELEAAERISQSVKACSHRVIQFDLRALGGSALTDTAIDVPEEPTEGIPVTYVPARNTLFLSFALAYAEVLDAGAIFVGVNAVDYSGYPDCRPEYINAFQEMANLATKVGVSERGPRIHAPLIELSKAEIIKKGMGLGVDYSMSVSCYQADQFGRACGRCESCRLRREGFVTAKVPDPTRYI